MNTLRFDKQSQHDAIRLVQVVLVQVGDDGLREVGGARVAAQISGLNLAILDHLLNGALNSLRLVAQVDVLQHSGRTQQHGRWIRDVLADRLTVGMPGALYGGQRNGDRQWKLPISRPDGKRAGKERERESKQIISTYLHLTNGKFRKADC